MQTLLGQHWHHLPVDEVIELLQSDSERGLDVFEVRHRQERFGPNALTPRQRRGPLARFLMQFNNPLIYILLAASVVAAIVKGPVDAAVIVAAVIVNTVVGYVQESRAEEAIAALAQTMVAEATVLRSGETLRLPASALVPGDVVLLRSGDKVPADLRLLRSRDLQIAEAALTGESVPVAKQISQRLRSETPLAERTNMAYASTLVTYGQGRGVVIATGDHTEVGRISELISSAEELETPLTRNINRFSQVMVYAILTMAALAFAVGVLRGEPLADMVVTGIAVAVATIPEGLPTAVTVTLAIGVSRMARRRAIIRRLAAVEALGSTTIICSDKTGTLTQNQMTVRRIFAGGQHYQATGSGYEASGTIIGADGEHISQQTEALTECLRAGVLCNDSRVVHLGDHWTVEGDPTEGALLVVARKAGLSPEELRGRMPRLDGIPFESQNQYMATLHDAGSSNPRTIYAKGAWEAILQRCDTSLDPWGERMPLEADGIQTVVDAMATEGLRVLAFARAELPPGSSNLSTGDVASGMTFLGLQGMLDPPRPEAIAAVSACQRAGITVKMITGDHPRTAASIAEKFDLCRVADFPSCFEVVLTGTQMELLSDSEIIDAADRTPVFGRVTPEQKLRLVEALQARGHVVAMTGDGVNDAPALKQADIGVAMGITGTDVAKEAADMVLTDDNFASIEAAVEEGRGVFDNLTKLITWALPTNLGEGLVILLAILAGVPLPILPVQILWVNMITSVACEIVLTLEPKEPDIMLRRPRNPNEPILTPVLLGRILLVGVMILVGTFGLFELAQMVAGMSVAEARTVAVNVLVAAQIFYLLASRSLTLSLPKLGLLTNPWLFVSVPLVAALQILLTYAPFMNAFFQTAPIPATAWAWAVLWGLVLYAVIEIEKSWRRRRVSKMP